MSNINYGARSITFKIVYYGPALSGKTTNLEWIHINSARFGRVGQLTTLNTREDRTIFFDFLPFDFGTLRGFNVQAALYTVPGQVIHDATRKIVLKGADAVVFVADSQPERIADNLESINNLQDNLKILEIDFARLPYVLQLNKRDLPGVIPPDDLTSLLRQKDEPVFETIAAWGQDVLPCLRAAFELAFADALAQAGNR